MQFEKILSELGKNLDELVEKAPQLYKEKIEKPVTETFEDLKSQIEEIVEEIKSTRVEENIVFKVDIKDFNSKNIETEIDPINGLINIYINKKGKKKKLVRQVVLPETVDYNEIKIDIEENEIMFTISADRENILFDFVVQVVHYK